MLFHTRNGKGSAITETGPALFVLLIIVFFPLMDIIGVAADFAFANLLHNAEIREASIHASSELIQQQQLAAGASANAALAAAAASGDSSAETIAENADKNTISSLAGYAQFCGISLSDVGNTNVISHTINYLKGGNPSNPNQISDVEIKTIVSFRPFLRIPFMPNVPGLSANMQFSITSSAPQEEQGLNG